MNAILFKNMRDRRNTSLSVSSTSSSNSSMSGGSRTSLHEKRPSSPTMSSMLPLPVTKENRSRRRPMRSTVVKALFALCCVVVLLNYTLGRPAVLTMRRHEQVSPPMEGALTGGIDLPGEPTTLLVSDASGSDRWTVHIPRNASFPLRSAQYRKLCSQGEDLSDMLRRRSRLSRVRGWRGTGGYDSIDRTYLDVEEALQAGAVTAADENTCRRSLTFVMGTDDASFGKTLLLLWLSYGLAMKEGRAFFIEDSRWTYGTYESYFTPLPSQGCSRPPTHRIVPCPHQANHLLVSAATVSWTFGSAFEAAFTQRRASSAEKGHPIFDLVRAGHDALFHLTGEDALYAASRIAKWKDDAAAHGGSTVGMQVRRGDHHPHEYQFSRDYLPLDRYALGARRLFRSLSHDHSDVDDLSALAELVHSPLVLASDDPTIIESPELTQAASPFVVQKAQERIHLATKATLDKASPAEPIREPGSAYVKHVDENSGWEGGFYSALFFSLGSARTPAGSVALDEPVPEQAMRMRKLVGRAWLLDVAIMGEMDGVVCAVSSATCRVLGVMLGWDAVKEGRWMNVDDGRAWSWDGRR